MLRTSLCSLLSTLCFTGLIVGAIPGWVEPLVYAVEQPEAPTTKTFTYKTTKDGPLEIVVHYPPGWTEADQRPVIVFFFGGKWRHFRAGMEEFGEDASGHRRQFADTYSRRTQHPHDNQHAQKSVQNRHDARSLRKVSSA